MQEPLLAEPPASLDKLSVHDGYLTGGSAETVESDVGPHSGCRPHGYAMPNWELIATRCGRHNEKVAHHRFAGSPSFDPKPLGRHRAG